MPRLEATFVPGGFDDYYMPEVVAPAPQRVMPEVPQNMQEDLQRMELEANSIDPSRVAASSTQPSQQGRHGREASLSNILTGRNAPADQTQQTAGQPPLPPKTNFKPFTDKTNSAAMQSSFDAPSFSPFPRVKGENVPPGDEEKEEILYNAQQTVLHSNNVSMQLSWARDALSWVETSAEAYAREHPNEGKRPQTPKIEHDLRLNALSIVDYLAQQGHPEAMFMRSKFLEFGKFGYRTDKKEAYLGYKKAAEQGWGRAEYRMGMLFENSNDIDKAIRHYNAGLVLKDSAASYRMGMMHLLGQNGFRRDFAMGLELIEQAAETADEDAPQGAYVYSMLISRDLPDITVPEGILPLDLSIARQYCEKAAYLGFAKAQLKMGQAYELCQMGCDFDPKHSLHYYGLAARQGQPEASLGVSRWFLFGYEREFPKNEQLAYNYAKAAALSGLATGEFAMGYYHEVGISVKKDLREARVWYERAADHDNKDAIARIAQLNQDKSMSKSDHETQALGRIKSQHGSMRGKRPDKLKAAAAALPTLTESGSNTPVHDQPPYGPPAGAAQPAFGVNLPLRPVSAAPYPVDDKIAPLNVRPKSTAPYPEDDGHHFKPRPGSSGALGAPHAPHADRPQSAFGIRSLSPSGRPDPRSSLPANNLGIPPAGSQPPRGRMSAGPGGWESQPTQQGGGYRQPSPHAQQQPQPPYDYNQPRPMSGGGGGGGPPIGDPTRNRLTKNNPSFPSQQYPTPGTGPAPVPGHPAYGPKPSQPVGQPMGQPGRDYSGGRVPQARPVSDMYMTGGAGPGHRTDSMPMQGHPGGGGRLPADPRPPMKDRPAHLQDPMGGRSSAPPAPQGGGMGGPPQGGRPGAHPTSAAGGRVSTPGSTASAPAKPPSQGPATFEQMGIVQGKEKEDCIVM